MFDLRFCLNFAQSLLSQFSLLEWPIQLSVQGLCGDVVEILLVFGLDLSTRKDLKQLFQNPCPHKSP